MTSRNLDYSKIEPYHFFSSRNEKTKFNWFAFELACEIDRAVPNDTKKYLSKRGYTKQTFNKSCIDLAILLQGMVLKKLAMSALSVGLLLTYCFLSKHGGWQNTETPGTTSVPTLNADIAKKIKK